MTAEIRLCANGHAKVKRPYGWHCAVCQLANARARQERAIAEGKIPRPRKRWHSDATPHDSVCTKGHPRVRRPSGELACPTCQNAWKAARRRAERLRACAHVGEPGYTGVLSTNGEAVCLACVVEAANAA